MVEVRPPSAPDVPIADLRAERNLARRSLEIELLRGKGTEGDAVERLRPLREQVQSLTQELIARYSADLSLVDSLLESPYPASARKSGSAGGNRPEVTA